MPGKALVVDANILVRSVLGKRVPEVMEAYAEEVTFFVPEAALAETEEHLPALVIKRGGDPVKALAFLHGVVGLVEVIGADVYEAFEAEARERLHMDFQQRRGISKKIKPYGRGGQECHSKWRLPRFDSEWNR